MVANERIMSRAEWDLEELIQLREPDCPEDLLERRERTDWNIVLNLKRQRLVLTEAEIKVMLGRNPEIWRLALKRGKADYRAEQMEKRERKESKYER